MDRKVVGATCAALAAVFAGAVGMRDAGACGFVYYGPRNEAPVKKAPQRLRAPPKPKLTPSDQIAEADRLLEQGDNAGAIGNVVAVFAKVRTTDLDAISDPLQNRAARVLALAFVRGTGAGDDLAWAGKVLDRVANKLRTNDPVAKSEWAEWLARNGRQNEAYAVLAGLAKKDLLGSAPAYAAYARLLSARGDGQAAADAAGKCEAMTKSPAICKVPATPGRV